MIPNIAILDIETAPVTAMTWGLFDQNIGLAQIVQDQWILSFAAKTLQKRGVRYMDVSDQKDITNDFDVVQALWHELNDADFVIAHNGRRFDVKKINARFITHGFPPPSPFIVIDTLLEVRRVAAFTSNKLEYLTAKLCKQKKLTHGKFAGFLLWKECLLGNPKAWKEMRKYNIMDIISLEELYLKLRPWMAGHPNLTTFVDGTAPACPKCGSKNVVEKGMRHTSVSRYVRYQCQCCMGWSRGRFSVRPKTSRDSLLVN